ncbi:MAG: nickel pincer cofactor biosynthesis protein LarB [Hyphomicrobiales bacterium]|nr:nickel pincer cofactor biosynthesis protein LarB [Hyphomicrobiales bacterium]
MITEHLIDYDRENRIGISETIFCENKSVGQIKNICKDLDIKKTTFFTRLKDNKYKELTTNIKKKLIYDKVSETAIYGKKPLINKNKANIAIICAGTSDMPSVLEAQQTLYVSGVNSDIFPDLGVAGLWRIQKHFEQIIKYKILIVVAGMDGALVSVIGGLVSQPIIALPTSTGYGVANKGLTALNAMLTSCSPGISVVNIDNGYGAASAAIRILNAIK